VVCGSAFVRCAAEDFRPPRIDRHPERHSPSKKVRLKGIAQRLSSPTRHMELRTTAHQHSSVSRKPRWKPARKIRRLHGKCLKRDQSGSAAVLKRIGRRDAQRQARSKRESLRIKRDGTCGWMCCVEDLRADYQPQADKKKGKITLAFNLPPKPFR